MRFTYDIGSFEIDSMPNQPCVALCHSFSVKHEFRGKGFGKILKQIQNALLIQYGYNAAICTVRSTNIAQIKVLNKCGWNESGKFFDDRNGLHVFIYQWVKQ